MGYDIYGKAPKNVAGEYFRNNIWWWHKLWEFTCIHCEDFLDKNNLENGFSNSGQEFNALQAKIMAARLETKLKDGTAKAFKSTCKDKSYPFTLSNLREFIKFVKSSGGFNIS